MKQTQDRINYLLELKQEILQEMGDLHRSGHVSDSPQCRVAQRKLDAIGNQIRELVISLKK